MAKHRKDPRTWAQKFSARLDTIAMRLGLLAFFGLALLGIAVSAPTGGVRDPQVPLSTTTYVVHQVDVAATLGVRTP